LQPRLAGPRVGADGYDEREAQRIIRVVGGALGLPQSADELQRLRKDDPRKVMCAALVKGRTAMSNEWLAKRLAMGHPASRTQLVNRLRKDGKNQKTLNKHEKILKSKD